MSVKVHGCLETAPPQVKLTFSEPIQPSFAALTVTRPDGQRWERSEPKVNNRDVSVDLDGRGPAAPSPSHSGHPPTWLGVGS
ncbi:copper resistance protein CopC [Nocardia sp. NPDC019304]|uniref:copper resistance CopC family protein n=1 Tax=unclassified Nocardia TaxID=2637762 RepID=UPI0033C65F94